MDKNWMAIGTWFGERRKWGFQVHRNDFAWNWNFKSYKWCSYLLRKYHQWSTRWSDEANCPAQCIICFGVLSCCIQWKIALNGINDGNWFFFGKVIFSPSADGRMHIQNNSLLDRLKVICFRWFWYRVFLIYIFFLFPRSIAKKRRTENCVEFTFTDIICLLNAKTFSPIS